MTVLESVERDLEAMRRRDPGVADSGCAAAALQLARELDSDRNSATSKAMCAKALLEMMETLRSQLPPAEERDRLDELAGRRSARLGRSSGS